MNAKIKFVLGVLLIIAMAAGIIYLGLPKYRDHKRNNDLTVLQETIESDAARTGKVPINLSLSNITSHGFEYHNTINDYQYFLCSNYETNSKQHAVSTKDYDEIIQKTNRSATPFSTENTTILSGTLMGKVFNKGRNCYAFESPKPKYLAQFTWDKCGKKYKFTYGPVVLLAKGLEMIHVSTDVTAYGSFIYPAVNTEFLDITKAKIVDKNCNPLTVDQLKPYDYLDTYSNGELNDPQLRLLVFSHHY
ncbi:MAG TPA: hypothetical protein VLE69_01480 [Candidatus Saccharimonadales bacterium]|nr:hypothetical protein [Candidatus Saccharimonadales bacterium]